MPSPLSGGLRPNDADATDGRPLVAGRFEGEHILVPLLTGEVPALTDQLKIATTLARVTDGSLTIVNPISIPEQTPKTYHQEVTDSDDAALLRWVFEQTSESLSSVDGDFLYTRDVVTGVLRAVRTRNVDTLVMPGESRGGYLRAGVTERIAAHADADVVVVNGRSGFEKAASVLLPVAGGPHSGLAADVAASIASDCAAWIDVLHVVEEDAPDRRRKRTRDLVDDVRRRIDRPETTTTWVLEATDVAEAIIEQSQYYGLTIIGAPTKGRLRKFIFGSTNRSVRARAGSVVLSTRNNSQ